MSEQRNADGRFPHTLHLGKENNIEWSTNTTERGRKALFIWGRPVRRGAARNVSDPRVMSDTQGAVSLKTTSIYFHKSFDVTGRRTQPLRHGNRTTST